MTKWQSIDSAEKKALSCARCGKRLSRKTARTPDGKEIVCSTCLFAPPPNRKAEPPQQERPE